LNIGTERESANAKNNGRLFLWAFLSLPFLFHWGEAELPLRQRGPVRNIRCVVGVLLYFLVSEGGEDKEGRFHHIKSFDDGLIAEFFAREVFALLLRKELISQALVKKILEWRHSGFNVHSRVRAQTKKEAERVGKYMRRPLLSLERLSF
jgi:hypothetical protein